MIGRYQFSVILLVLLLTFQVKNVKATHIVGGEINWDCLSSGVDSGKFIFRLVLYRRCDGPGFSSNQFIQSTTGNYLVTKVSQTDLSYDCYDPLKGTDCNINGLKDMAIEEYVYESQPVTLNGIPPVSGWEFYYKTCCRTGSPITDNLHPQSQSYRIISWMYPYVDPSSGNTLDVSTCYDSSPRYIEKPGVIYCTGHPGIVNLSVGDSDLNDVIKYDWLSPKNSNGGSVTWATHINTSQVNPRSNGGGFIVPSPGFSKDVPLPWSDTLMDSNNQPATLDTNTGVVQFLSHNEGNFAMTVRATSYRGGQRISEIRRDITIQIRDCKMGNNVNTPPLLIINDTNGLTAPLRDSIAIFENIDLNIESIDLEYNSVSPLIAQTNQLVIYGQAASQQFTDTGCMHEPCAYVDSSKSSIVGNQVKDSLGLNARFHWQADCNHLDGVLPDSSNQYFKEYLFHVNVFDDFCNIPALSNEVLSLTVLDTVNEYYTINKIENTGSDVIVEWQLPSSLPTSFVVLKDTMVNGNFSPIDTLNNSSNIFVDTGFGGAQSIAAYSIGDSNSVGCVNIKYYQVTSLDAQWFQNRQIVLNWNGHEITDTSVRITYKVYKKDSVGGWNIIDSVIHPIDSILLDVSCDTTHKYRIEAHYNYGFISISNSDSIRIEGTRPIPSIISDTIYALNTNVIGWLKNDSLLIGQTTQQIQVQNKNYYQQIWTDQNSCIVKSDSLLPIDLDVVNSKAKTLALSWSPYDINNLPDSSNYAVFLRLPGSSFIRLDTLPFLASSYNDTLRICDSTIEYYVLGSYGNGSFVISNLDSIAVPTVIPSISTNGGLLQSTQATSYQWYLDSILIPGATSQTFLPIQNGLYYVATVDSNNCIAQSNDTMITWASLDNYQELNDLVIYPNPANEFLIIQSKGKEYEDLSLEIIDINGKVIENLHSDLKPYEIIKINLGGINRGIYILHIRGSTVQLLHKILVE